MMTPWITAAWTTAIAAAILLCALHAAVGAHATNRRYRLAWTDPAALADPPTAAALVQHFATSLASVIIAALAVLLVPASPLWRPEPLAGPVIAVLGFSAGGAMFRGLIRWWSRVDALLAAALITLGACGLTRIPLTAGTSGLAHLQTLVVALALMAALWAWLAGVWMQQLDHGAAWTVAGRLIPWSRWFAAGNGLIGVFIAWTCAISARSATRGGIVAGVVMHLVLIFALTVGLRRWWGLGFMLLVMAALASMLVLISGPMLT